MAVAVGRKDSRTEPARAESGRAESGRRVPGSVVGLPGTSGARAAPGSGLGEGVLVIGREIEVRGEIGSCRTLVVEGRLQASVEVGSLELAEDGLFDGRAEVETADIAGRFEGELTVRGELRLRPTARVNGVILYGRIVIEGGGEMSGEVGVLPESERIKTTQD